MAMMKKHDKLVKINHNLNWPYMRVWRWNQKLESEVESEEPEYSESEDEEFTAEM